MRDINFIKDSLVDEIYFTDEEIRNILIRDMIYEPYMEEYFPELVANVDKAYNTITELVDRHIMHKLNTYPYTWDNSKLTLQVDNVRDLCNANYPEGQKAAVEVNDRICMVITCDPEDGRCECTISYKPDNKYIRNVFAFTYEDNEWLRTELIDCLYKIYNTTFMCDMASDITFIDNLYFGYRNGKELGEKCFMLGGTLKTMYKKVTPVVREYLTLRIESYIALYEPITEVNPTVKYKNGTPYLEYK